MNLLDTLSNKFFYHLIGPLQPYFKRRLQEAQVNVKEGTIQDIAFSPDALNKLLSNSPVLVENFWIARLLIASYEPLRIELHSPILTLKLNPDYVPSQADSSMSMTEMAMSSIKVAEEVMKESVAAYLDNSKSANSEILRRMINVLLHRVSVVVKGLVIALEVPNQHNPSKLDILRIRVDELKISDSSHITSYTQALDISYSSMYHLSEKKTAVITSFAIEIFQIDSKDRTDILHLTPLSTSHSTALSIPGDTLLHFELCPQPFNLKSAINFQNINVGLDTTQIGILGSLSQKIADILGKLPPQSEKNDKISIVAPKPTFPPKAPMLATPPPSNTSHTDQATTTNHTDAQSTLPTTQKDKQVPTAPQATSSAQMKEPGSKQLFEAIEDDDDDEDFEDAENDEDDENASAELVVRPSTSSLPSSKDRELGDLKNASVGANTGMDKPEEALQDEEVSFSVVGVDQSLAIEISVRVSFLQMAIAPTLTGDSPVKPAGSAALATASLPSSTIAHSSIPCSVFNLESLAEPSKSNRSFVYIRFMDLEVLSRQGPQGDLSIEAALAALAIHERYKISTELVAQVPEEANIGEIETKSGYLTYPVLRIHRPHGSGKNKGEGKSDVALKIKHAVEHRVPTSSLEMDQISITLPGRLPKVIEQALSEFSTAFSNASDSTQDGTRRSGETSPSAASGTNSNASSSSSLMKDARSNDSSRFAGLVDSSSSSGSSLAASAASIPKIDDAPSSTEEEAPLPSKRRVKLNHLFVTLRFPWKFEKSEQFNFPVYRPDFIGAYVTQPSLTMYSTKTGDHSLTPPDSAEFQTISVHLLKGQHDITQLSRTSSSKRQSGSDAAIPKPFMKVTASASSDMNLEAITISRRTKPLSPNSFTDDTTTILTEYSRAGSDSLPPSSINRMPRAASASALSSHPPGAFLGASAASSSQFGRYGSSLTPPPSKPNFVSHNFDRAPFSSMAAKFEGDQQVPSTMDDDTYEAFRSAVMSNSEMAMTVTVHELQLDLEKSQCDLIQELMDSLSNGAEAPIEGGEKLTVQHPMAGIMSPISIDFRIHFATFNLTVEPNDYRFSNVENVRILFVNRYLHSSKTFVVAQFGSLRLPSVDPIPNSPPTLSKIPEFNTFEPTNALTVIFVTEALPIDKARPASLDEPTIGSRMTILVETNRFVIDHRLGERWIGDLSGFFVRDVPVDLSRPRTEVLVFVQAKNSALAVRGNITTNKEYLSQNPTPGDPVLLIHMEKLVMHSRLIIPTDPLLNNRLTFHFRVHTAQLFLIDDKGRVWLKPYEESHVKTMRQYWLARGYAPAGYLESLFAKITLNSIAMPSFGLELNLNGVVDTTGDQVYTLLQFITSISSPVPDTKSLSRSSSSSSVGQTPSPSSSLAHALDEASRLPAESSSPQSHSIVDEEEEPMVVTSTGLVPQQKVANAPVASSSNAEQYVLVQLTPEQMKQRELELEQLEWQRGFKIAKKPPSSSPVVRFVPSSDGVVPVRMPKLVENYRPVKQPEQLPIYTFIFSLNSENLAWRLREGVSLSDEPQQGSAGIHQTYHDVLSQSPGKYVDLNLRGLRIVFTSDPNDQTDLSVKVKRYYFMSAMDGAVAKPFIDLDRTALSSATHMLSLRLSTLYDLQEDASPALRPVGFGTSNKGHSRSNEPNLGSNSKNPSTAPHAPSSPSKTSTKPAPSSILVFATLPLSIRVDIEALDFMRNFYTIFSNTKPPVHPSASHPPHQTQSRLPRDAKGSTKAQPPGPYFHRVSISAISLNLNVSAWAVRMDDAVIKLPSIYSRGVEGWEGVSAELSAVYSPLLYSSLFTFAGSLPVVRLVTSVLGSVSNLVINPYSEYQQGRSAAAGAYGALTVGATSVASELLRFGAWVTSTAGDGLQYLESFWRTPDSVRTTAPANVQQGAQLGYANVMRQVAAARDCLVVMPWKEYENNHSVIGLVAGVAGAVPLAILKPVIGATHGLSNVMQGASNAIHVPGKNRDHIPATAILGTSPGPSPSPSHSSTSPARR